MSVSHRGHDSINLHDFRAPDISQTGGYASGARLRVAGNRDFGWPDHQAPHGLEYPQTSGETTVGATSTWPMGRGSARRGQPGHRAVSCPGNYERGQ